MVVFGSESLQSLLTLSDDAFGPRSDHPWVLVSLADLTIPDARRLSNLPCPMIGLGEGPAAPLLDLVVADLRAAEPLVANIASAPLAALVLVQTLRAGEGLIPRAALTLESLAFAALQGGPEFRRWLSGRRRPDPTPPAVEPVVRVTRDEGELRITLNRPWALNAVDVMMRDLLAEALDLALADDSIGRVTIEGVGRCFSVGGDVAEFGEAPDAATAHWVRTLRGPARRLIDLRDRLTARVQGGVVGAGLEMAAFAGRLVATPDAWFQLPELRYGLIPGAGGTVSVPARVGRQRTAWLALSMRRLNARTALEWGLIDAIEH